MLIYAIIEGAVVTNTIVWDGITDLGFPSGITTVLIPDGTVAGIGYCYDATSKVFTTPS